MNAPLRFALAVGIASAGAAQAATPVANNDSYQTGQGQMMSIAAPGVLGNDTDADMDTLTASVVSNPLYGTLMLNADGSFTYNPNSTFYGTDSFSYAASDGSTSDEAVVSLTVTSSAGGGGGGYSSGAPSAALLALLAIAALYRRGLKPSKRRAISP
ncbi:MAG: Ig-like domain-containing protein [Nevskiaceae bacterium]